MPERFRPLIVIGLDYKKITVGDETAQLLLMVDRFSGFATLVVMWERKAACTMQAWTRSSSASSRKVTVDGEPEALRTWVKAQGSELGAAPGRLPVQRDEQGWTTVGGEPNNASSMHVTALPPSRPQRKNYTATQRWTAAARTQEAAEGDPRRRACAVSLKQAGRSPRTYKAGDAVVLAESQWRCQQGR